MKLNEQAVEKIVKEELEKFLKENPNFQKMLRAQAQDDAAKAAKRTVGSDQSEEEKKAAKDKAFRLAQKNRGGTREIEFEQQFPKTTPPKTSGKSSSMISQAVKTSKEKKGDKK